MSEKQNFAEVVPGEKYPRLEYTNGRLAIRDVFRGNAAMPLRVEFVYRPLTQTDLIDGARLQAKAPPKPEPKPGEGQVTPEFFEQQVKDVAGNLLSWVWPEGVDFPCDLEGLHMVPVAVINFIWMRIIKSSEVTEEIAKNSESLSNSQ